jgi:hypothetical protein
MLQLAFQPINHIFNSILPLGAGLMVMLAILSSLPGFIGKKAKGQLKPALVGIKPSHALSNGMRLKAATLPATCAYRIPTSMRTRSRNY